jgi:3-hydroxyisobutyrate dehydrogenase-like beta-hydroxyacid dehydrogenase
MKIGLIGAGRMGRPIADQLAAAGHEVVALTRQPRTASAEGQQIAWATTVSDTVRDADVVFTAVFDDAQLREVCLGPDAALAAARPGAILVQHTTCNPETVELLARSAAERDVRVLDAALSGGPHDIVARRLTLWVGGEQTVLARVRPLFETYACTIMPVGPVGNGQRVKLVNNALFVAQVGLAIDAVRLAGSLAIEETAILAALQHGSGASRALGVVAHAGSVDAVASRLADFMVKDVAAVRAASEAASADLGLIGAVLASDTVTRKVLGRSPIS